MREFSEKELQALAFGDADAPALSEAERAALASEPRFVAYQKAAAALRPLAQSAEPVRPGLASRVRARIAQARERESFASKLLRVARFEVPALAAAALVALFLGYRAQPRLLQSASPRAETSAEVPARAMRQLPASPSAERESSVPEDASLNGYGSLGDVASFAAEESNAAETMEKQERIPSATPLLAPERSQQETELWPSDGGEAAWAAWVLGVGEEDDG